MADQIGQMGVTLENQLEQLEELQSRYDIQVHQCSDLTCKLYAKRKYLNQTASLLANAEEELRQSKYTLKERDFIICGQKKAAREDKLSADNRSVVNNFQTDLAKQLGFLSNSVATSVSQQNEHILCVEKFCHSFLESHDQAVVDLKRKIRASSGLYASHLEAMQNVVKLHKASSTASLEEISALASSNSISIKEFLDAESVEANSLLDELQSTLSTHQGEMALFAGELRQRFHDSIELLVNISEIIQRFFDKLMEESKKLERHASAADEILTKFISEFEAAYEEQSKAEAEKLIADMTTLFSNHLHRQKELVGTRLVDLRETVTGNKTFLDGLVSSM